MQPYGIGVLSNKIVHRHAVHRGLPFHANLLAIYKDPLVLALSFSFGLLAGAFLCGGELLFYLGQRFISELRYFIVFLAFIDPFYPGLQLYVQTARPTFFQVWPPVPI